MTAQHFGKSMTSWKDFMKYQHQNLPGQIHQLDFPFTIAQLKSEQYGAPWLTKAFQASGALPPNVQVTHIKLTDVTNKVGGGAARKALLEVTYSDPQTTNIPQKFFIKLPSSDKSRKFLVALLNQAGPEVFFSHLFASPIPSNNKGIMLIMF